MQKQKFDSWKQTWGTEWRLYELPYGSTLIKRFRKISFFSKIKPRFGLNRNTHFFIDEEKGNNSRPRSKMSRRMPSSRTFVTNVSATLTNGTLWERILLNN